MNCPFFDDGYCNSEVSPYLFCTYYPNKSEECMFFNMKLLREYLFEKLEPLARAIEKNVKEVIK